jgi:hypothetical protein
VGDSAFSVRVHGPVARVAADGRGPGPFPAPPRPFPGAYGASGAALSAANPQVRGARRCRGR